MNTLIKSSAIPSFRTLTEEFWNTENLFDYAFLRKETLPAINIKENDENFEIEVAAPGYQKKDFKIDVQNGVLNISAETSERKTEEEDNYTRKEFSYSAFNRSFTLPDSVNEENVHARYENGLLFLKLKKAEVKQPKKNMIPID
jgi:HSP20 family protein